MKIHPLFTVLATLYLPQGVLAETCLAVDLIYDSELSAVTAATNIYNPLSIRQDREYIGTIVKQGNKFGFTVAASARFSDKSEIRVDQKTWRQSVALWHTHGGPRPSNRYFSATDTQTAERFNMPFYLADYTGYLKVFNPGDSTLTPFVARRLGLNTRRGYAIGNHVLDSYERPVRVNTRR